MNYTRLPNSIQMFYRPPSKATGEKGAIKVKSKDANNKVVNTFSRSIDAHTLEVAYEITDNWCKREEKLTGFTYYRMTLDEFKDHMDNYQPRHLRPSTRVTPKPLSNPSEEVSNLRNRKYFGAEIRRAIETLGMEQVVGCLEYGLNYVKEVESEIKAQFEKEDEANQIFAKGLFDAYEKTGIELIQTVNDPRIKEIYAALKADKT